MQILPSPNAFADEIRCVSLERLQTASLWLETLAHYAELRGAPDLDDVLVLNDVLNQEIALRVPQSHTDIHSVASPCPKATSIDPGSYSGPMIQSTRCQEPTKQEVSHAS
jgi:hypothetical protein